MVLSEQDKKILLDRLKAGREKKKAEREAAKKTTAVKAEAVVPAEQPVSAPSVAPETAPVVPQQHAEQLPSEPPRIDPSKTRKPAKRVEASSDSDSEVEERKNKSSKMKNKKKNVPYMKIKIYQEPKNHEALNALIGAVQEEQAPLVELSPPEKQRVTNFIPKQKLAAPIVRQNTMRALAMDIFG